MLKWFPCEMHCHTLHSDGKFTVESLMQTAKEYGLSGIALTDHNTVSGWDEITEEREKKYVSAICLSPTARNLWTGATPFQTT